MTISETLVNDLASLCSTSGTGEAVGHLLAFCHESLLAVGGGSRAQGASEVERSDLKSVASMLEELTLAFTTDPLPQGGSEQIDPRLFSRMLKKVVQVERGAALAKAISNMPFLVGSASPSSSAGAAGKKVGGKSGKKPPNNATTASKSDNNNNNNNNNLTAEKTFFSLLPSFLRYTCRDGSLQSSLVLLKLLLVFLEDGFDATTKALSVPLETMQQLERCIGAFSEAILEKLPAVVREKRLERAQDASPLVLLTSGKPAVYKPLEVEGDSAGFVSGVRARGAGSARCYYFEATVRGEGSVAVGWARARGASTGDEVCLFDCSTRSFVGSNSEVSGRGVDSSADEEGGSDSMSSGDSVAHSNGDALELAGRGESSCRFSEQCSYLLALVESGIGFDDLCEEMATQDMSTEERRAVLVAHARIAADCRAEPHGARASSAAAASDDSASKESTANRAIASGSVVSCVLDTESGVVKIFVGGAPAATSSAQDAQSVREALASSDGVCPYFVCSSAGGAAFNVGQQSFDYFDACLDATESGECVPVLSLAQSPCLRFSQQSCLSVSTFSAHSLKGVACEVSVKMTDPSPTLDAECPHFSLFSCCVSDDPKINWSIYNISVDRRGRVIFDCDKNIRLESAAGAVAFDVWKHVSISFSPSAGTTLSALPLLLVDGEPVALALISGQVDSGDGPLVNLVKASLGRRLLVNCEVDASSASPLVAEVCCFRVWSACRSAAAVQETLERSVNLCTERDPGGPQLLCSFSFQEGSGAGLLDSALIDDRARGSAGALCAGFSDSSWGLHEATANYKAAAAVLLTNEHGTPSARFAALSSGGVTYSSSPPEFGGSASHLTVSVSLGELLFKLSRKLYTISSNWLDLVGQAVVAPNVAKVLLDGSNKQSVVEASINTFSLLQSLLQQISRMCAAKYTKKPELLAVISVSLSQVIQANLVNATSSPLPLSSLGLQRVREQGKCLVSSLLSLLCKQLSEQGAAGRANCSAVQMHSVAAVIAGWDIFFPEGADKLLVASCLLARRAAALDALPRPPSLPRLLMAMQQAQASRASPLGAVLAMSTEARQALLEALLEHLSEPSQLSTIVPSLLRPVACGKRDSSSGSQPAHVLEGGYDVIPLVGDTVERGPGWSYGEQDGGAGSRGVVTSVSPWGGRDPAAAAALRLGVVWLSHGRCNSYQWGTVSADGRNSYDVLLLRPMRSAAAPAAAPADGSDSSPPPDRLRALLYTPKEVRASLVEHTGDLSKRVVLVYMKEVATIGWLERNGLAKSVNSIINRVSGEAVAALYAEFYSKYSLGRRRSEPSPSPQEVLSLCEHLSNLQFLLVSDSHFLQGNASADSSAAMGGGLRFCRVAGRLLGSLQALLTGAPAAESSIGSGSGLEEAPLTARLATRPFIAGGCAFRWAWGDGYWTASEGEDAEVVAEGDAAGDPHMRVASESSDARGRALVDAQFDCDYVALSIVLSDDKRAARQTADQQWNTIIASTPLYPNTGSFRWYTRIDKLAGSNVMLGVVSEDFCCELFVGQDDQGWGLGSKKELFHAGERLRSDFGSALQAGDVLEVTMDTDSGVMLVANSRSPAAGRVVAFDDIEETLVYPAWTLYSAGDALSITTEAAFRKASAAAGARSSAQAAAFVGAPHPLLLHMCRHSAAAAAALLTESPQSISSPFISALVPQLLASLHLWECSPVLESRRLLASLTSLQKIVWECIHRLRWGVAEAISSDAPSAAVDALQTRYNISVQLCTLLSAYTGVVVGSWMSLSALAQVDNHMVAMEAPVDARSRRPSAALSARSPAAPPRAWLKSALFSQGPRAAAAGENKFLAAMMEHAPSSSAAALVQWVAEDDATHPSHRRLGGEHLSKCVRLLFAATLYHSGLLHCASSIAAALGAVGADAARPPAFLAACWSQAMKLRVECSREVSQQSTSYEALAGHCEAKITLMLDLEQCRPDQIVDAEYNGSLSPGEFFAAFDRLLPLSVQQVVEMAAMTLALATDESSAGFLRANLAAVASTAALRLEGLKALRSSLGRFPDDFGWGARCALLVHSPFGAVPARASEAAGGGALPVAISHYTSGLEGSSRLLKQELKGAFDSLYAHLTDELVRSSTVGEGPLQLLLLGALGVVVQDGDHTLLARVNIFHALQEILEGSIGTGGPPAASTRAAVKLFILLALQVASSGSDGPSNATLSTRTISSSRSMDSNSLKRVRSGPATLSSAVFEILFSQITMIMSFAHVSAASSDALVVLTEATTLLVIVSQDPSCQRTLRSPRWILLLLDVVSGAPTVCRRNALLALQDVLAAVDLQLLQSSRHLFAPLCSAAVPPDVINPTVAQTIVYFALGLGYEQLGLGRTARQATDSGSDTRHLAAEVVCLLRLLVALPGWKDAIEQALVTVFTSALNVSLHERSSQLALAGLSMLGGHMGSLYVGSPALAIESDGQGSPCIVTALGDIVEVHMADRSPELSRSISAACVRPVSRVPLEGLRLSAEVVLAAVPLAWSLLGPGAIADPADPLQHPYYRALSLRALSELTSHPWSADIIQGFLSARNSEGASLASSLLLAALDTSVIDSKSNGVADADMLEECVVRGVAQRRRCADGAAAARTVGEKPLPLAYQASAHQEPRDDVEDDSGDDNEEEEEEDGGLDGELHFFREWSGTEDAEAGGSEDNVLVEMLASMGFPRTLCLHALELCGFDFDEALNYILSGGDGRDSPPPQVEAVEPLELPPPRRGGSHFLGGRSQFLVSPPAPPATEAAAEETAAPPTLMAPRAFYYAHASRRFLPIHSSPHGSAERIGAIFPGDDVAAYGEVSDDAGGAWLRVRLADFLDDEEISGEPSCGPPHEDPSPGVLSRRREEFGWAPRQLGEATVVKPGSSPHSGSAADSLPPESLQQRSLYRVGAGGAAVRVGVDLSSGEVGTAAAGETLVCIEECYSSQGKLQLRIVQPLAGWVSKLPGRLSKLSEAVGVESQQLSPSDASSEASLKREMDLLQHMNDELEQRGGQDIYRREDRYFNTLQGSQYQRCQTDRGAAAGAQHRREVLLSAGAPSELIQRVEGLCVLYARRLLIALLYRCSYRLLNPTPASPGMLLDPAGLVGLVCSAEGASEAAVAAKLTTLLRLTLFRGSPGLAYGTEGLALPPLHPAGLPDSRISADAVLRPAVLHILSAMPLLQESLLGCLARDVRAACGAAYSEHSWGDPSYHEESDEEALERPNVHLCVWISRLMQTHAGAAGSGGELLTTLMHIWSCALRAASTSLKHVACAVLTELLTASGAALLPSCLQLLPLPRLRSMCARRLWYEMEDHPIYSRFLQAAVHLLAVVDACCEGAEAAAPAAVLLPGEQQERGAEALSPRPLMHFVSSRAHVSISPVREIQGSWTLEAWLLLKEGSGGAGEASASPSYLLTSSAGFIKLRCGGRLFGASCPEDLDGDATPVNEKAMCASIGQKGCSEQIFDAVLPTGRWFHLAISCCCSSGGTARTSLYIDAELADTIPVKFQLPLATIGSSRHGQSFNGWLAHLRVWSQARSAMELRRCMCEDAAGAPGLLVHLRCSEGSGSHTFDSAALLHNCKLSGASWATAPGPVMSGCQVPAFMLGEQEEGSAVVGDEGWPLVRELTGSLLVLQAPGVSGEFANDSAEVVTLCFRAAAGGATDSIEGYVDWSERGVRTSIIGAFDASVGRLSFETSSERVYSGPPEALQWLRRLVFDGSAQGACLSGECRIEADVLYAPLCACEARLDKLPLHRIYSFKRETATLITSRDWAPMTVAFASKPRLSHLRAAESKEESLLEEKADDDPPSYGLCAGDGCLWVDWRVVSASAGVTAGACGSGLLLGALCAEISTAAAGDIVSVCVDADGALVSVFRNGAAVITATLPDSLSAVASGGVRPFIALRGAGDAAEFLGERSGPSCFSYLPDDPLQRLRFEGEVRAGRFDGVCSFQRSGEDFFWHGRWGDGGRVGLQLRCRGWLDGEGEVEAVAEFAAGTLVAEYAVTAEGELAAGDLAPALVASFAELRSSLGTALRAHGRESEEASLQAAAEHEAEILSLQENIKRLYKAAAAACITFSLRDSTGAEVHFKVSSDIRLQKVFDVYSSKKGIPLSSLQFFLEGEAVSGEHTPEALSLRDGEVLDVRITTTRASDEVAVRSLLQGSATFVVEIVYTNGATVRNGVEIEESSSVRMLRCGDIVEAFEKSSTREGVLRYRTADGWISERLRGGGEERILLLLRELFPSPDLPTYRVVRASGAKLRAAPLLASEEQGRIPAGTEITVSERRLDRGGGSERSALLRVASPERFAGGWVRDKTAIVEVVGAAADPETKAEIARRAEVRAHRRRRAAEAAASGGLTPVRVQLAGSLNLSSDTFFLLNGLRRTSSDKLSISADFRTVSCSCPAHERPLVAGSRGFSRGIHYWEVAVDSASYGSVFIGAAPVGASNWGGYGVINYRATQAFGSEKIYGSYFGSPDTIGVLLDMDHGTISFFKEGNDFMLQKVVVVNMGVAYHNLRRNSRSSSAALFPCFGLKNTGDQLSLRRCRWLSRRGLESGNALARILQAKQTLYRWPSSYGGALPARALQRGLALLQQGAREGVLVVTSRPGVEVDVMSDEAAQRAVLADLFDRGVRSGSTLRSEELGACTIVGVRGESQVWFKYPDQGAWYWPLDELRELLSSGLYSVVAASPAVIAAAAPTISDEQFADLAHHHWSFAEDETLVSLVNRLSSQHDCDPSRIPAGLLEEGRAAAGALQGRSAAAVQVRYCLLCALSGDAEVALPLTDVGVSDGRAGLVRTQVAGLALGRSDRRMAASGAVYCAVKSLIFSRVKQRFWQSVVAETATPTGEPPDQYDRPDDIREIPINRILARSTERSALQGGEHFALRLRRSVFGQLREALASWDERALRRSFVHMQDAGQARAFYVKLVGEGGDDNGGPYRAVFLNSLADEAGPLLELLVPTPNATAAVGQSQDRLMLNPEFTGDEARMQLYTHLGRLMGMGSRHGILVPVSAASVIWRSLAGEVAGRADMQGMDASLLKILRDISSGRTPRDEAAELLVQALQSCCSQRVLQRLLGSVPRAGHHAASATLDAGVAQQLCSLVEHLVLSGQQPALQRLYNGLCAVLPAELFAIFTTEELERMLCGEAGIDMAVLKKATVYEGVSPTDEHVKMFWGVVEAMDMEERSQLINFCSGRSRLPAAAEDFPMKFKLTAPPPQSAADPDAYLPKSQTCFFSLSLPRYSSAQVCKEKLQYAIRNTDLIDSDFVVRNAAGWE